MSRAKLINAFNALAEAAALVAIELEASDQPASPPPAPVAAAADPVRSVAVDTSRCPKHGREFKPSKNAGWPAYCTAMSDDPAWSNAKGYCRINSDNAGEWLAVHGAAAA